MRGLLSWTPQGARFQTDRSSARAKVRVKVRILGHLHVGPHAPGGHIVSGRASLWAGGPQLPQMVGSTSLGSADTVGSGPKEWVGMGGPRTVPALAPDQTQAKWHPK